MMKSENIMRGLECCQSVTPLDCRRCPYKDQTTPEYKSCCNLLVTDALALLREKDARIEELEMELDDCVKLWNDEKKLLENEIDANFEKILKGE